MADVGKVTIETVASGPELAHRVSATVSVGGSLVDVRSDTLQDAELAALVDQLYRKLTVLALDAVQASLRHREQ